MSRRFGNIHDVLRPPDCVIADLQSGDLHGPRDYPPGFEFVLDETDCAEVDSLPGGCTDAP